ncbi:hypothetical protein E2C01_077642 [Portunus trituberculatus]|uniref:Uncharacterized protein n=1 Tax=Portunus trituberculatus TaxID=210409 RepID=A0A5B7IKQ8_PORTR|nr:hypothetical protein [Portunus trituberculatus]
MGHSEGGDRLSRAAAVCSPAGGRAMGGTHTAVAAWQVFGHHDPLVGTIILMPYRSFPSPHHTAAPSPASLHIVGEPANHHPLQLCRHTLSLPSPGRPSRVIARRGRECLVVTACKPYISARQAPANVNTCTPAITRSYIRRRAAAAGGDVRRR